MYRFLIASIVTIIASISLATPLLAQNLNDRIPEAISLIKEYSKRNNIPLSYIRHDLLAFVEKTTNESKKNLVKQINMQREEHLIKQYHKPAWFEVEGTTAYMYGIIGPTIYTSVKTLMQRNPNLEKIVMIYVPGSIDDFTNFKAIQYLRDKDIILEISPKGFIASGGVDFLLAGTTRRIAQGAKIGVHSRRYNGVTDAISLSRDDERHTPWLDFYDAIGMKHAYYRFVLDNATADEVHWLTDSELLRFEFSDVIIPEAAYTY